MPPTAVQPVLPSILTAATLPNYHPAFSPLRVQHSRRFSKCSISEYKEFLQKGGGSCLFNRPNKVRPSHVCPLVFLCMFVFLYVCVLLLFLFMFFNMSHTLLRSLLAAV